MTDFIDDVPSGWKRKLSLSEVYRDRASIDECFEFPINGKVRHWGQEFSFETPVKIEIEASRADEYVIMNISVSASVSTACSRCLDPAGVAINGKLRYLFSLRSYREPDETEESACDGKGSEEEIVILPSWDEAVDVGEMAWETLITALPPAVLCSEDCLGLCRECGANLNEITCNCQKTTGDPRFEALKKMLEEEND